MSRILEPFDWKPKIRKDIDEAAEEIKASAFETIIAADKLIESPHGVRIVVELSDDCAPIVRYEINPFPRGLLPNLRP